MSKLYKDTFRALMIDQHFPDAPYITFERFNAVEQVRKCKEAFIDSLHITMKCHWGYSYYNTRIGIKHPALGNRDQAGELIQESRKAGIEAIAYYCILFENLAARRHEDWRFIDKDGKAAIWSEICGVSGWRWGMPCFMTGYRQYCLDQIAEFSSQYELDGLFLDIFGLGCNYSQVICYCPTCMGRYAALNLNPYSEDPIMKFDLVKHWMQNWADFLTEIRGVLDANRTGMSVSLNGGPFFDCWNVLKQVSWPFSEGGNNPRNSVILRGLRLNSPQCGIPAGNDAYDAWPPSLVKIMTSTVLAHGCRTFFFFTQGRLGDGTFEESKYNFIRCINEETAAKQEYVKDAEPLTAAAVYHSEASWLEAGVRNKCGINEHLMNDTHAQIIGSMIDAFRIISIPCEFLPVWHLSYSDINRFQFIVIPEQKCIGDEEVDVFTRYVENGGLLLVTGETGMHDNNNRPRDNFALADLLGIDYDGICTDYEVQGIGGYMRFENHPFFARLRQTDYYMPGNFIQVKPRDGVQVLACIAEPVGIENPDQYIGWNSLPPGKKAKWPCLTMANYGKGSAIYCAAPLGRYASAHLRWPSILVHGIADALKVGAGIYLDAPEGASEATFFRKDGKLIVHVLNQSVRNNNGVVIPLCNCAIKCTKFLPKSAWLVFPQSKALKIKGSSIILPPVDIHAIVEIVV